jgi:hypothetical protein
MDISKLELTTSQQCEAYGVTKVTLGSWHNQGMPKTGRSRWPFLAGFRWYMENIAGGSENSSRLATARASYWETKAKQAGISFDMECRNVLLTSEVTEVWGKIIFSFKNRITAMPRKLAPIVLSCTNVREAEAAIEQEVHLILTELSNPDFRKMRGTTNEKKEK